MRIITNNTLVEAESQKKICYDVYSNRQLICSVIKDPWNIPPVSRTSYCDCIAGTKFRGLLVHVMQDRLCFKCCSPKKQLQIMTILYPLWLNRYDDEFMSVIDRSMQ